MTSEPEDDSDVAPEDESSSSDDGSLYRESTSVPGSATGTPLKNILVGSKSTSSDLVKRLESKAHEPNTCILTRATNYSGLEIQKSHINPRSIKVKEVGDVHHANLVLSTSPLPSYVRVNGCSDTMQVLSTLIHITMSHFVRAFPNHQIVRGS